MNLTEITFLEVQSRANLRKWRFRQSLLFLQFQLKLKCSILNYMYNQIYCTLRQLLFLFLESGHCTGTVYCTSMYVKKIARTVIYGNTFNTPKQLSVLQCKEIWIFFMNSQKRICAASVPISTIHIHVFASDLLYIQGADDKLGQTLRSHLKQKNK